jgi:hypothetical protein
VTRSSGRSRRLVALCLIVVAGSAVYLVTSPDNRFEADDAYDYAAAVEYGDFGSVVSPLHLAYIPVVKALYEPTRAVAPEQRSLPFMVFLGAVAGGVTVVLFYLLMFHWLEASKAQAAFGACALGVSYGFWRYTAEAEVYALASLAAVLLLLVAVRIRPGWPAVGAIAILASVSILTHALNLALVLALPVLLVQVGWPRPKIIASALLFGTMMLAITFGAYSFARANGIPAAQDTTYMQFYAGGESGNRLSPEDLVPAVGAMGTTVVAANSLFVYGEVRDFLTGSYPGNAIAEELTMGATSPKWLGYLAPVVWLTTLTALAVLLWKLRRARFTAWRSGYTLYIWLGAYLAIALLGRGVIQPEVWLLALVPFWAIIVGAMQRVTMSGALPWLVVISLAANSLINGFLPVYLGDNRNEEFAQWPSSHVGHSDLILTADSAGTARYLAYQTPAHTAHIGVGPPQWALENIELLEEMIAQGVPASRIVETLDSRGLISGYKPITQEPGELYVTRDLFDPPDWLETSRPASADALRSLGRRLGHLFVEIEGTDLYLMRVADE